MKHNLIIKPRSSDYSQSDGHIQFKAVSNGIWPVWFNEDQRNPTFDSDGCACYAGQKSIDSQMDILISNGTIPSSVVNQLSTMGFMDTGIDGKIHFHSSPRFIENLTGNGQNGNSMPEVFDTVRKYGLIPWTSLPFTQAMTPTEYFSPIPESLLSLGQQFLALMGGKNFVQYHWIANGETKDVAKMQSAILQAPLLLGIAIDSVGWNQATPIDPSATQDVQHAVMCYSIVFPSCDITDNYVPYLKVLDAGYPIPYVLQAVVSPLVSVSPTPVIPAPIATSIQPTEQNVTILTQIVNLYTQIINLLKGRNLTGINMENFNFSFLQSVAFWSKVVLVLSAFFTALYAQFPNVMWIGTIVSLLSFISATYFQKKEVVAAATSSAALGKAVSGQ